MVVRKGRGLLRKIKDNFKHINNRSYSFLTNLPSELIQAITTFLDTPKFCSLRLTCGRIYASFDRSLIVVSTDLMSLTDKTSLLTLPLQSLHHYVLLRDCEGSAVRLTVGDGGK